MDVESPCNTLATLFASPGYMTGAGQISYYVEESSQHT
jgi:hypothetical protein